MFCHCGEDRDPDSLNKDVPYPDIAKNITVVTTHYVKKNICEQNRISDNSTENVYRTKLKNVDSGKQCPVPTVLIKRKEFSLFFTSRPNRGL